MIDEVANQIQYIKTEVEKLRAAFNRLELENEQLRAGLVFYALKKHIGYREPEHYIGAPVACVVDDGELARTILELLGVKYEGHPKQSAKAFPKVLPG